MAVTTAGTPDKFSPAWNPIWFYLTSPKSAAEAFQYILDIFPAGNTTDRLVRYKMFPRIGDNYGKADVNQVLRYQITKHLSQNSHTFSTCAENFYGYDAWLGEQYVVYWPFVTETNLSGGQLSLFSSTAHTFVAGDNVYVQFNGNGNQWNGSYEIVSAPSPLFITLDNYAPFAGTSSSGGTVVYQNKRATIFSGQTLKSGYTAWNGAIEHEDFMDYTASTYNIGNSGNNTYTGGTSDKKWLTNIPSGYNVRPENCMWLNFYSTTMAQGYVLELTTNNGVFYFPNELGGSAIMNQVAVGPLDINHFATSATSYNTLHANTSASTKFDCDTTEYSVRLVIDSTTSTVTSGGTIWGSPIFLAASEKLTFRYNSAEAFKWNNIEVYFMDRKGSIVPCNFELLSLKSITKTDATYKSIIGDLNVAAGRWQYDSTEAGTNVINTVEVQQMTVSTNWMTVAESNYFKELFTSKFKWVKENGKLWPVIIKETSLSLPTKNNKKNINKVLTLEYANNNVVQN